MAKKRIKCDDFLNRQKMGLTENGMEVLSCNDCLDSRWVCGTDTFECDQTGQCAEIKDGRNFMSKCPLKKVRKVMYYEEI